MSAHAAHSRQSKRAIVGRPQFLGRKHLGDCGIECRRLLAGSVTELRAGEPVGARVPQHFLSRSDPCLEHERLAIRFVDERMLELHDVRDRLGDDFAVGVPGDATGAPAKTKQKSLVYQAGK